MRSFALAAAIGAAAVSTPADLPGQVPFPSSQQTVELYNAVSPFSAGSEDNKEPEVAKAGFWSENASEIIIFTILLMWVWQVYKRKKAEEELRFATRRLNSLEADRELDTGNSKNKKNIKRGENIPSKARLIMPEEARVRFSDVAGIEEVKTELQEIVEFLKNPEKFTRLGAHIPKGQLLSGPPGTGKTLLAQAVAGEAGRPVLIIAGTDFDEMYVGVGPSRVRDLFETAKAHAPCIIFIDEIDAVGQNRGSSTNGEKTLNAFLVEMDGFLKTEGVIVVAATNRPDILDPALVRPGRFDRHVMVPLPDVSGRRAILEVHAKKVPLADDVDFVQVARETPGFSGADLANVINEAAIFAARAGQEIVTRKNLQDAIDKELMGTERKSLALTEKEKYETAVHEAGHAVIGFRVPGNDPVTKISIVPRGRALGVTVSVPERDKHNHTRQELVARLAMLYGGRAAEELFFGADHVTTGASGDIEEATRIAREMVTRYGMSDRLGRVNYADGQNNNLGQRFSQTAEATRQLIDEEVRRLTDEAYEFAKTVLTNNRTDIEILTRALMEKETVDGEEARRLLGIASPQAHINGPGSANPDHPPQPGFSGP